MLRRELLVLVLLALSSCSRTPPLPASAERAAQEPDVREATFRHMIEHNHSVAQKKADFIFLSIGEGLDPSPEELARFAGQFPPVEPASAARIDPPSDGDNEEEPGGQVRHGRWDGHGLLLEITRIRWIDMDTVEVEGEYHEASLSAAGYEFRVERKSGRWTVTKSEMRWIS